MSHIHRWKKEREVHYGECPLDDLFTKVVGVEVHWPVPGLVLEQNNDHVRRSEKNFGKGGDGNGVRVKGTTVSNGADPLSSSKHQLGVLRDGDCLLAIGSIDVEYASVEHVTELLDHWPPHKPITMLLS